jgi:hypothetical protein
VPRTVPSPITGEYAFSNTDQKYIFKFNNIKLIHINVAPIILINTPDRKFINKYFEGPDKLPATSESLAWPLKI